MASLLLVQPTASFDIVTAGPKDSEANLPLDWQ